MRQPQAGQRVRHYISRSRLATCIEGKTEFGGAHYPPIIIGPMGPTCHYHRIPHRGGCCARGGAGEGKPPSVNLKRMRHHEGTTNARYRYHDQCPHPPIRYPGLSKMIPRSKYVGVHRSRRFLPKFELRMTVSEKMGGGTPALRATIRRQAWALSIKWTEEKWIRKFRGASSTTPSKQLDRVTRSHSMFE